MPLQLLGSPHSVGRWSRPGTGWSLVLLTGFLLLAGCASTEKRYEKAVYLEGQGRYEDAAEYYIKVLRKEPSWPEAKDRLRTSGDLVVDASLEHAEALAGVDKYEEAVRVLARMDVLREQAAAVGVLLTVPEDYEEFRQDLTYGAITSLIRRGERAEQSGNWQAALNAYQRVLQHYDVPFEQRADLEMAQARVFIRWGEDDLDRRYFRAAHGRAAQAIQILGPDAALSRQAFALQEEAIRAGTRHVAFLPVWSARHETGSVPDGFLQELNDVLRFEHWSQPPLFIATANPADVYRELRRFRYERGPIGRAEAADVGRALAADLVVVGNLAEFDRKETVVREQRRKARTRGRAPVDTLYLEQEIDLHLEAEVAFQVVDPHTRDVVYQGTAHARVSDRLERGRYGGNPRDLDLSSSARRLFDPEAQDRVERDLEAELMDELSQEVARRVYDVLLGGIH